MYELDQAKWEQKYGYMYHKAYIHFLKVGQTFRAKAYQKASARAYAWARFFIGAGEQPK